MTEQQITECLPMVALLARRMRCAKRLPPSIDTDDLISAGHVGLVDAASRFNESHGTTFKTFAGYRIRGAMLDFVRDHGPLTRGMYAKAQAGGLGVFEYSLDEVRDLAADTPDLDRQIIGRRLSDALHMLSTRDRYIINEYYFKERTDLEISTHCGVNESRVNQLRKAALATVRAALTSPPKPMCPPRRYTAMIPRVKATPTPTPPMPPSEPLHWATDETRCLRAKRLRSYQFKPSTLKPPTLWGEPR